MMLRVPAGWSTSLMNLNSSSPKGGTSRMRRTGSGVAGTSRAASGTVFSALERYVQAVNLLRKALHGHDINRVFTVARQHAGPSLFTLTDQMLTPKAIT